MAIGCCLKSGSIWDSTEGSAKGLVPCSSDAIGGEYAGIIHIIGVTDRESAINGVVVGKSIVCAAHFIVNMRTKLCSIWVCRIAHLQTENTSTYEINPLDNLSVGRGPVLLSIEGTIETIGILTISIRENNPAERIPLFIRTVRIEF